MNVFERALPHRLNSCANVVNTGQRYHRQIGVLGNDFREDVHTRLTGHSDAYKDVSELLTLQSSNAWSAPSTVPHS